MKVKVESEKTGLKLSIQKTKIMASGPNTSWEIDGETVSDFIIWGSKITTDGGCSHEIKRHLTLLVGMQTSTATMENSVEIPQETGNRTAIQRNPTAGHTHRGNQN